MLLASILLAGKCVFAYSGEDKKIKKSLKFLKSKKNFPLKEDFCQPHTASAAHFLFAFSFVIAVSNRLDKSLTKTSTDVGLEPYEPIQRPHSNPTFFSVLFFLFFFFHNRARQLTHQDVNGRGLGTL